jgi:Astacin (Peptidase family M12A)
MTGNKLFYTQHNEQMKMLILYFLLIFFSHPLFARQKTDELEGRWVGTYGNNEKDAPYYFSFEFLPGGKMNIVNQNNKILGSGTFSEKEGNIKIVYKYSNDVFQYACNGSFNRANNSLSGGWQRLADAGSSNTFTQHGKWVMKKSGTAGSPVQKNDSLFVLKPIKKKDINPLIKKLYNFIDIKTCTDLPPVSSRPLPARLPTNYLTQYKINADGTVSPIAFIRQSLATYTEKMWEPGQTITVGFDVVGGTVDMLDKVKQYAKEWELYANIKFEFLQGGGGMIRIGFKQGGSYSLIGRDALLENPNKTTMNFGWLASVSDAFARQVILHEFGHALGFVHEHQTFGTAIAWDKEKVYAFYAEPPGNWTREQVDQNIFNKFSYTSTNYSSFDRQSIMLYPVPKELTITGDSIPWNMDFSPTDKQYAALFYPFPTPPPTAGGVLKTGDDCDEIAFTVEYDAVGRDKVEFNFELGELNGKKVSWWKQIGIPQTNNQDGLMWVQNHSLIPSENNLQSKVLVDFESLNKNGSISFWKAKLFGVHTALSYKWNIMQALRGGCRVTLVWRKDSCL